ncbi:FAD-dependent oxidoreductase [Amycolatopsis sp., V23-08]|uniref:FAD-dependent oxidoreductase n=1 Tax=Amycolatopsis heterodermiae TaxID=3110235 RepID=A0ABU5R7U8_9PSEU|nr:FAD-dependent oxidoreductase [Amycolatopsis sp., V23-08]MEA5362291.1 FAD-dependent oxidoreductase [Amycolatopsis sp., V23-08]
MGATHAEVAVVGGGIIGSCIAFSLAKKGVDVVVLDPAPGAGASAGNAGMLVPSQSVPFANPDTVGAWLGALARRDGAVSLRRPLPLDLVPWFAHLMAEARPGRTSRTTRLLYLLAAKSLRLYRELAETDGIELHLRSAGSLRVYRSTSALRRQYRVLRTLRDLGAEYEVLGPRALRDAEPGLHQAFAGAVAFPDDRSLDPARTTLAIADAARAHGARFRAETVVGARRRNGRVDAVSTDLGTVSARWFVVAAGAASARVGRWFGARLPVRPGYGLSLTYPTEGPLLRHSVMLEEDHVVIGSREHSVRLTTGMEFGGTAHDEPAADAVRRLDAAVRSAVPALPARDTAAAPWRGARPMTPSGIPCVGRIGENVVAATGHGTLGMTLGPVTGRLVSSLVAP